jgi:hypothetical protein
MVDLCIRRVVIQVDEIHQEMGKKIDPPTRKATAAAAIINPYAGNYLDTGTQISGVSPAAGQKNGRSNRKRN